MHSGLKHKLIKPRKAFSKAKKYQDKEIRNKFYLIENKEYPKPINKYIAYWDQIMKLISVLNFSFILFTISYYYNIDIKTSNRFNSTLSYIPTTMEIDQQKYNWYIHNGIRHYHICELHMAEAYFKAALKINPTGELAQLGDGNTSRALCQEYGLNCKKYANYKKLYLKRRLKKEAHLLAKF